MAREADIHGFRATMLAVGMSSPLLIVENSGQVSGTIKYFSGGSLEIVGVTFGVTYTGTSLQIAGTGYLFGTSEAFNYSGPARFYLCSTGATAVAYQLLGFGPGY